MPKHSSNNKTAATSPAIAPSSSASSSHSHEQSSSSSLVLPSSSSSSSSSSSLSHSSPSSCFISRVGGCLCRFPPVFSPDGRCILLAVGPSIKIYSASSLAFIASLEGHSGAITTIIFPQSLSSIPHLSSSSSPSLPPSSSHDCYSFSLDGTIRQWDLFDGRCRMIIDIKAPILHAIYSAPTKTFYLNINPKFNDYSITEEKRRRGCRVVSVSLQSIIDGGVSGAKQLSMAVEENGEDKDSSDEENEMEMNVTVNGSKLTSIKRGYRVLFKSKDCKGFALSPCHRYLASIHKNTLFLYNMEKKSLSKHVHACNLTTIVFHPIESFLATGDQEGKIILWHGYQSSIDNNNNNNNALLNKRASAPEFVITSLHWHAHPVRSTIFSRDGAYLLSGGEEGVLVYWQLATSHKTFLPRLGGAIQNISLAEDTENTSILLSLSDNSLKLINSITNKIEHSLHGFSQAGVSILIANTTDAQKHPKNQLFSLSDSLTIGLQHWEPSTGLLVINASLAGSIQFFDIINDQALPSFFPISPPPNILSRIDQKNPPSVANRIEAIAFSPNGERMISAERRVVLFHQLKKTESYLSDEKIVLKFWHRDPSSSLTSPRWKLNTLIQDPHKGKITSVAFSPVNYSIAITTGTDNTFKLWQEGDKAGQAISLSVTDEKKRKKMQTELEEEGENNAHTDWNCKSIGFYRDYRVHQAAWSTDGSLIAVSYGQIVTLWRIMPSLVLLHTIVHPSPSNHVRSVAFAPSSPSLITATSTSIYCFDLLSLSMRWSMDYWKVLSIHYHDTLPFVAAIISYDESASDNNDEKDEGEEEETEEKADEKSLTEDVDGEKNTESKIEKIPSIHFRKMRFFLYFFNYSSAKPIKIIPLKDVRVDRGEAAHLSAHLSFLPSRHHAALESHLSRTSSVWSSNHSTAPHPFVSIIYLNRRREFVRIDDALNDYHIPTNNDEELIGKKFIETKKSMKKLFQKQTPSLFQQIYGTNLATTDHSSSMSSNDEDMQTDSSATISTVFAGSASDVNKFLDGPSHVLPSASLLAESFMKLLLKRRGDQQRENNDDQMIIEQETKKSSNNQDDQKKINETTQESVLDVDRDLFSAETSEGLFRWNDSWYKPLVNALSKPLTNNVSNDSDQKSADNEQKMEVEDTSNSNNNNTSTASTTNKTKKSSKASTASKSKKK